MRQACLVIYLSLTCLLACDSGVDSSRATGLSIYLLKDPNLVASQIWDQPLESFTLADSPFMTLDDLKTYKWQTHEFTVTAAVDTQFAILKRTHGPLGGIPFVVMVEKERIYLGAFWYAYSSLAPKVPFIDVILGPHRISKWQVIESQVDERNDPRIYRASKNAGVLIE